MLGSNQFLVINAKLYYGLNNKYSLLTSWTQLHFISDVNMLQIKICDRLPADKCSWLSI